MSFQNILTLPYFQRICQLSFCYGFILHSGDEIPTHPSTYVGVGREGKAKYLHPPPRSLEKVRIDEKEGQYTIILIIDIKSTLE
jgi:hypothetical protein